MLIDYLDAFDIDNEMFTKLNYLQRPGWPVIHFTMQK